MGKQIGMFLFGLVGGLWTCDYLRAQPGSGESQGRDWQTERVSIGNIPILVPIPPEHVGGERVPTFLRQSNNPRNDLLAVYIRYVDAVVAARGVPMTFKTIYRVEVLKRAIGVKVTREELESLKRSLKAGFFERHAEAMTREVNKRHEIQTKKELSEYLGQNIERVAVGKPETLGVFDEGQDWVGIALLSKVQITTQGQTVSQPMISTINTLLVKDRMLTALVMRIYEERSDLDELVDDSKERIKRIVRANALVPSR